MHKMYIRIISKMKYSTYVNQQKINSEKSEIFRIKKNEIS